MLPRVVDLVLAVAVEDQHLKIVEEANRHFFLKGLAFAHNCSEIFVSIRFFFLMYECYLYDLFFNGSFLACLSFG